MSDNNFIPGLFVKAPVKKDGSPLPEFIKAKGSMKVADLKAFLDSQGEEWVNFDTLMSKGGKWYCEIDTWKPSGDSQQKHSSQGAQGSPQTGGDFGDFNDDIPF